MINTWQGKFFIGWTKGNRSNSFEFCLLYGFFLIYCFAVLLFFFKFLVDFFDFDLDCLDIIHIRLPVFDNTIFIWWYNPNIVVCPSNASDFSFMCLFKEAKKSSQNTIQINRQTNKQKYTKNKQMNKTRFTCRMVSKL